jgi:hypothetical protein
MRECLSLKSYFKLVWFLLVRPGANTMRSFGVNLLF